MTTTLPARMMQIRAGHELAGVRAAVVFTGAVVLAALVGDGVGPRPGTTTQRRYASLRKLPFQPSPQVFAPTWTVLYSALAISGFRVWSSPDSRDRTLAQRLWGGQLPANAAWTPTFFGARRPKTALGVLTAQLSSAVAFTAVASRTDCAAGALMVPYLGWSAFAFGLGEDIVSLNRS